MKMSSSIVLVEMKQGIYKQLITFPFGMRDVNCYLIKGDKGYTVLVNLRVGCSSTRDAGFSSVSNCTNERQVSILVVDT